MIDKILREVKVNLLDGINLDIEQVPVEAGEDYVEFVRELSIELTKVGCKLSIDTYVPYAYNKHYDLKEFITTKDQTLQLEHSLVSLSKWESKYKKPFLSKEPKSQTETTDYIKFMTKKTPFFCFNILF